jgi:hypothetical protein
VLCAERWNFEEGIGGSTNLTPVEASALARADGFASVPDAVEGFVAKPKKGAVK